MSHRLPLFPPRLASTARKRSSGTPWMETILGRRQTEGASRKGPSLVVSFPGTWQYCMVQQMIWQPLTTL